MRNLQQCTPGSAMEPCKPWNLDEDEDEDDDDDDNAAADAGHYHG